MRRQTLISPEASGVFVGQPAPNPASGVFALDVRLDTEATVSVYDALGRRVAETTALAREAGQSVRIPTTGFAPGAYLVVVEAPGVRETRRVTVLHYPRTSARGLLRKRPLATSRPLGASPRVATRLASGARGHVINHVLARRCA